MADLPSIADRLNDIEISSGAPLTETVNRRYGSNINFLLDFLGITDGETSTSGDLADFLTALSTVSAHTIALQVNAATNSFVSIGSYTPLRFVDRVFWQRNTGGNNYGTARDATLMKQIDGGPTVNINASRITPGNTSVTDATSKAILGSNGVISPDSIPAPTQTSAARKRYNDAFTSVIGYESPMRDDEWGELGTLSWREFSTTANMSTYHESGGTIGIYMSYKLNLESAPIFD